MYAKSLVIVIDGLASLFEMISTFANGGMYAQTYEDAIRVD